MSLAAASGLASFDQSNGEFLDLSNELAEIIRRDNTAFLSRIGISGMATETSHKWMEDALNPNQATGAEAIDNSETTIDVASGHGTRFKVGTLFKVAYAGLTEVFQVTAISTDALTVTRGYGSTSAEDASAAGSAPTLQIISHPVQEGADAPDDESRARTQKTNYTQIFQRGIKVSHTMRSVLQAGVADEFTFQISRRLQEIMRELDNTIINGIKSADAGSDSSYRTMGGLLEWVSAAGGNTTTTAEALTLSVVNSMAKQIWDDGGTPDFLLVGGKQKRQVSTFDQSARRSVYDANVAGYVVDKVVTDLGFVLDVIVDPWIPDDVAVVGELARIRVMPLQGDAMRAEDLAKTGRAWKSHVTGQYTMEVRNALEAFAYHNNLT